MEFKIPNVPVIFGVISSGLALIFQIIGMATDGWLTNSVNISIGIWGSGFLLPALMATRAFAILGLLFVVACLATGVLQFFNDNATLPTTATGLAFAAAGCILIEFAVFAGVYGHGVWDLSYSFALTVVSFVLCVASGVCFLLPKFIGTTI